MGSVIEAVYFQAVTLMSRYDFSPLTSESTSAISTPSPSCGVTSSQHLSPPTDLGLVAHQSGVVPAGAPLDLTRPHDPLHWTIPPPVCLAWGAVPPTLGPPSPAPAPDPLPCSSAIRRSRRGGLPQGCRVSPPLNKLSTAGVKTALHESGYGATENVVKTHVWRWIMSLNGTVSSPQVETGKLALMRHMSVDIHQTKAGNFLKRITGAKGMFLQWNIKTHNT